MTHLKENLNKGKMNKFSAESECKKHIYSQRVQRNQAFPNQYHYLLLNTYILLYLEELNIVVDKCMRNYVILICPIEKIKCV